MAINAAFCDITLNNGTGTGTWKHPDQIRDSAPEAVEMDDVPQEVTHEVTASDGVKQGLLVMTSRTRTGVTFLSTHLDDETTIRVHARVKNPIPNYQYG